ncbi:tripartite tricarboxylate transporter substrate binding protein [Comamonas testosteroni]|uniref:tripartite tricarboxylate transporter substrate binding protein n=1 Tax=Comamonas testosteroni TaxID=285 RepID=UPI003899C26C
MATYTRRTFSTLISAVALPKVWADSSSRPITVVVPFAAGGQLDVMARVVSTALGEVLATSVVVENVPGAGGVIAARKVLAAPADGLTIFQGTPSQLVLAGLVNKELALNSKDFTPIHMIGTSPYVIMARSALRASSADELVLLAREAAQSGAPLTYASVGVGTLNHVMGEELSRRIGAPLIHVPYKGGSEVMRDLAGGRVDLLLNIYTSQQIALAGQGRFKFLAAMSTKRQPLLPSVPSVDEGHLLRGFYTEIWTGLFVKDATPAHIVANLNKAMTNVLASPAIQKSLLDQTGTKAAPPQTSRVEVQANYESGLQQFRLLAMAAGVDKK